MGRGPLKYPFPLWILYPAVLLSGATALAYEVVWARQLALVLGSATSAAAAVLSAFMFGLAVGAIAVGWRADDSRRPLRWYGLLELGIGIYALAFDTLLELVVTRWPSQPWLASFVVLFVPAALMGGTLPVLARAGADTIKRGASAFGSLYGVNTLGAVVGALLAALVLLESLGLGGTVKLAALINIGLGVAFWILGMLTGQREIYQEEGEATGGWTGDAGLGVMLAFFLAGFAALALEMAWFRLLVYLLEGFTLAFGLMLAAYLLGLGAGALAGTGLALISGNPRRLLARIVLVEAVLAVGTLAFVAPVSDRLEAMRAEYVLAVSIDSSYAMGLFLAALAIVAPATFCAGMLMPVVARIALSHRESIGRHTGVVYAASTLGAVIAPPAAAFLLLTLWGVPATIAAMGALLLVAGTLLAMQRNLREWVFAGTAALAFVVACFWADLTEPLVKRSHVFHTPRKPRRLAAFEPGHLGDVSVVEELSNGSRRLYIDGFSAAETGSHYGYMRMQGHLPVLLHPAPKSALVIAFGTGTTAGAVSLHPEIERIVCVDIEPAVFLVAGQFAPQNRGVLERKGTSKVVADGREYVRRGAETFDIITLEPLMPYTPAAVYLYTREFYEEARRSLAAGGILCQWIPPQGVSGSDFRRLVASVAAAFNHVSLWYFKHAVLVLGTDSAPRIDGDALLKRGVRKEIVEDFRIATVGDTAHLLGAHVCSGAALRNALQGVDPMVDDKTDLEFRPLARGLGKRSVTYFAEVLEFLRDIHQEDVEWLRHLPTVGVVLRSGGAVLKTLADEQRWRVSDPEERGPPPSSEALAPVLERDKHALFALTITHGRRYTELMAQEQYELAAELAHAPDRSLAYLTLADGAEGEQRAYYLTLAVRQNALLDATEPEQSAQLLTELAGTLEGPRKLFCLNRAHALLGEPLKEGEEEVPPIALPDLRAALETGDQELARRTLETARQATLGVQVDRQAWDWFKKASDQRQAFAMLQAIGSDHTLRAALRLAGRGETEDLVAVAAFFCDRSIKRWVSLCEHPSAQVRVAAADAAKAYGDRNHLAQLAILCRDAEKSVRLSAFISFRDIEPAADKVGYNPSAPSDAALKQLGDLASNP
ncbi:MAG: fused MFS/spermidine synthase [Planctomycetota bacterium]|jgi:predicted membrane-bound spermidine synthase